MKSDIAPSMPNGADYPRPEPNAHVLRETLGMSDRITELVTDEALE